MQDFKNSENVISNGSFSKICSPGIRLGWIEAAPKIIARIAQSGILRSGGAVNNVMSGIIACSLQDGSLAHHINNLRNEYGNRMRTLCNYLKDNLPDGFDFQTPEGGYFIWIVGPKQFDGKKFSEYCPKEKKVVVLAGVRASAYSRSSSGDFLCQNAIRLSIAFYEKEILLDGANRLLQSLRNFIGLEMKVEKAL